MWMVSDQYNTQIWRGCISYTFAIYVHLFCVGDCMALLLCVECLTVMVSFTDIEEGGAKEEEEKEVKEGGGRRLPHSRKTRGRWKTPGRSRAYLHVSQDWCELI